MRAEAAKNATTALIASELVEADIEILRPYFAQLKESLIKIRSDSVGGDFKEVTLTTAALLHTLKGNGRSLGLKQLSNSIHEAEDEVLLAKENCEISKAVRQIDEAVDLYLKVGTEKLSINWESNPEELALYSSIEDLVEFASANGALGEMTSKVVNIEKWVSARKYIDFDVLHRSLKRGIEQQSELNIEFGRQGTEGWYLNTKEADLLVSLLNHLIRNSLAHGRLDQVTAPRISVEGLVDADSVRISFSDNGLGVPISVVSKKLSLLEEDARTIEDGKLEALLFEPFVSSKESADMTAGRGVGLYEVRRMARDVGGDILLVITNRGEKNLNIRFDLKFPPGMLARNLAPRGPSVALDPVA